MEANQPVNHIDQEANQFPVESQDIGANVYQQLALRTEAPVNEERFLRFLIIRNSMENLLRGMREQLLQVDAIKKFVFYGKENATFGYELPDAEDKETINSPPLTPAQVKFLRFMHAVLGILSECEECIDPVLQGIDAPEEINHVNGVEEFGDFAWYLGVGADSLEVKLAQILRANYVKLFKRYPDKFTEFDAKNRHTDAEIMAIEKQLAK